MFWASDRSMNIWTSWKPYPIYRTNSHKACYWTRIYFMKQWEQIVNYIIRYSWEHNYIGKHVNKNWGRKTIVYWIFYKCKYTQVNAIFDVPKYKSMYDNVPVHRFTQLCASCILIPLYLHTFLYIICSMYELSTLKMS